ncbi:MAG TPA: IPT/TIG domain-containing protein [Bryobacteraceae bacterium]|nr:IPT/TIG domain-containing protein [Bryobacteraceae bacterium]
MRLRTISFLFASLIAVGQIATLTPTPAALSFVWVEGTALPAAQTVNVKSGSSAVAYTTALAPLGTQWVTLTPSSGNLPGTISVLVNPSALPLGVNTVDIQFSATGFATITIPVTVTVEQPQPTLVLSASSLNFVTPPAIPAAQTLTLTTTGGPVTFSAAVASAPWLTVAPANGVVLPGLPITLTVSVNNTGINPGATAYSGKITILASNVPASNATQTVMVSMLVNALAPTVTNLYPSAALIGSGPLTVTVTGTGFYKGGTTATAGATPLATPMYVNPTTMLIVLPSSMLAAAGPINISAVNPAPGGVSAPSVFTVSATPVVQALVNAASYASGPVSPGEFVTLFGTAIGPAAPAGMSVVAGYATTSLGGVSVTIDGQAAAMIYVSANQLTVLVPYTVTIGAGKVVSVTNGGVVEAYAPGVTTTATAPGLFLDSGVVGQCAALRVSAATGAYSVNSSTNAALVGDTIVFYLTGEGIYDTAVAATTGYIVPVTLNPLVQLNPLPTVTIGGVAAAVSYAGVVPGGLLGLLQINAMVPAGSTTGAAVPVSITIGAGTTQAGATISVK